MNNNTNKHIADINSKTIFRNNILCAQFIRDNINIPLLKDVKPEDLDQLGRDFIRSAVEHTGTRERFLQKLDVLGQLTEAGHFGFGMIALGDYLLEYINSGCQMVSHSEQYRQNYAPAYRIIKKMR